MNRRNILLIAVVCGVSSACGAAGSAPTTSVDIAGPTETSVVRPAVSTSVSTLSQPPPTSTPSTTEVPASTNGCITTPGALQSLIDGTPDGSGSLDMKGKLVDAIAIGFSVLDLSDLCFENQGTILLENRYGLWIVRPTTTGSDWTMTGTSETILSGLFLNGGSLTITGGSQRIEAGEVHDLSVIDATDFMMGKMNVTGHAVFDSLRRVDPDKSFVRNSTFNSVELVGNFDGFKIENSTAVSLVDNVESATRLNFNDMTLP